MLANWLKSYKTNFILLLITFLLTIGFLTSCIYNDEIDSINNEWREYQGGPHRNQYSALKQINLSNVSQLKIAWKYSTQDTGEIETNPIIIGDTLYGMTPGVQPFAIDAATGREYWQKKGKKANHHNRGLTYWEEGKDKRILYTQGPWLYALDAMTGKFISSFGEEGHISLKSGLDEAAANKRVYSTTPGTVYEDLIIMPLTVPDGVGSAKGYIQAFNIKTGKLKWVFHTIPKPGHYGYNTWPMNAYKNPNIGGANSWAGMAIDRKRGIIYIPTGSPTYDYYGGNRKGRNLFANTLLALDARTGDRIWHFQFVHHDILDRDLPAPPNLLTVIRNGKQIDAVAQVTKQGYVFVFDRETGDPLFPIKENPVPQSNIPGEHSWPTQPFPTKPIPFARQTLTEDEINPHAEDRKELIKILRNSRSNGPFTPLSEQGTIVFPGLDGGADWSGAAVDPEGVLYVNSNQIAFHLTLIPTNLRAEIKKLSLGQQLFTMNCSSCHGANRKGYPESGYPSLVNIKERKSKTYVTNVISNGKGMMPTFENELSEQERQAIVAFLFGDEELGSSDMGDSGIRQVNKKDSWPPYQRNGGKLLDEHGRPAITPPWGSLNAINLNTGQYIWKDTLGHHPELESKGIPPTGSQNYGGPLVTAGNLLFIAGTKDAKFRAYNKKNGNLIWETKLPAAGFATPSTYQVNGKQYVVIACGGTKLGAEGGNSYVAFTLPNEK